MKTRTRSLPCGADCANTFSRPTRKSGPSKAGRTFCRAFGWRYNALYLAVGKVCGRGHPGTPSAAPPRPIHKCILILGHRFAAGFAAVLTLLLLEFGGKNHAHGAGRRTIDERLARIRSTSNALLDGTKRDCIQTKSSDTASVLCSLNSTYQFWIVFRDEKCAGAKHGNSPVTLNRI
jgi:hypothetical protein